jgi:hypothetical protein
LAGKKIFASDQETFKLVNGKPFRSIRNTVKHLPISNNTLQKKEYILTFLLKGTITLAKNI